jgi:hypothetical protein
LKIIVAAMAAGVAVLSLVALGVVRADSVSPDRGLAPVFLLMLALGELPAYFVIRQVLIARLQGEKRDQAPDERHTAQFLPPFTTLTIIAAAMAEGFGLFGAVIYMVTRHPLALAAPAIAVLLPAAVSPTEQTFRSIVATVTGGST